MDTSKPIIMVVEDDPLLNQAITKKLEISNLTPLSYTNGQSAIERLLRAEQLPDLIWLDYTLTDMDGLAFMSKLKEIKQAANIPVIVVSSVENADDVFTMLGFGVKQYIFKTESHLEDIIKSIQEIIADIQK